MIINESTYDYMSAINYEFLVVELFLYFQDSSAQLGSTSREQLMWPEYSKQGAELLQIACGGRTNIKFVLISVLQPDNETWMALNTYHQAYYQTEICK